MIDHCKEKDGFRPDPIKPGQCVNYWPDHDRCTNPILHYLLPTQALKDAHVRICPTKGVRP